MNYNIDDLKINKIHAKDEMISFYLDDPINKNIERSLNGTQLRYFYFEKDLTLQADKTDVINGCLLAGQARLTYKEEKDELNRFDFFFLPPNERMTIELKLNNNIPGKICIFKYNVGKSHIVKAPFEIQHFSPDKFIPRGELSSEEKMCTYRTVWTAIKNGYFMSGFTNIPNDSLKRGVITSVNLEKNPRGSIEIYPHIHPDYPEVYIMCIDDNKYAISQYMINLEGESVCRDLKDGEGLFFPGSLGHCNFARPFYKNLKYCMYMWIIPTFGKTDIVSPITLKV